MANEDPNSLGLAVDLSELSADLTAVTAEIEAALRDTGEVIAQELKSAARSGEADFSAMARSIAEELASIALQRVFSANGPAAEQSAPLTLNVAMPQAASQQSNQSGAVSANAVASLIAQAVLRGRRFS